MTNNNRTEALTWWYNILGYQYGMIVKHKDTISGGEQRHPTSLTGREIENLYKVEHLEKE